MTEPTALTHELAKALALVQADLPKLERDRTVTVEPKDPKKPAYSYSYATLANLSEQILPVLGKHGLSFTAWPTLGSDGKLALRYHLLHSSGQSLSGEFPLSAEGGIQILGGRITYARRYCLAAVVGLAAEEDDDGAAAQAEEEGLAGTAARAARGARQADKTPPAGRPAQRQQRAKAAPPPLPGEEDPDGPVGQDQHRHMHALWRDIGYGDEANRGNRLQITAKILGLDQLDSSADLTRGQADQVITALADRKKKMAVTGQQDDSAAEPR